jgi:glucans biosynthesis protein C
MQETKGTKIVSTRRYELDWLRVFAILALLFFHTGRIFDTDSWHIKNNEVSENFIYWMPFLHAWRMPLLLFISGAGSYFAFKSILPFLIQRVKRLVIPFIFGLIVILPPQVYFENLSDFNNYWDVYKSISNFLPFHDGQLNLYHLWFLGFLFIYSIIALPILMFLHSNYSTSFSSRFMPYFFNPVVLLLVPPIFIMLTQIVLLRDYPGRANFAFYLCFFLLGMFFYSSSEYRETITENRKYFLASAFAVVILAVLIYSFQGKVFLLGRVPLGLTLEIFVGWFWIITIVAYGKHYLSYHHQWVTILGDGIISFYILHQTAIVVIGYFVCQQPWSIAAKFWSISFLTLIFCITFYVLCIRPFNVMRIAFGMKLKPAPSRVSPAVPG